MKRSCSLCPDGGGVGRRDVLHNRGDTAVTLFRSQARFVFLGPVGGLRRSRAIRLQILLTQPVGTKWKRP